MDKHYDGSEPLYRAAWRERYGTPDGLGPAGGSSVALPLGEAREWLVREVLRSAGRWDGVGPDVVRSIREVSDHLVKLAGIRIETPLHVFTVTEVDTTSSASRQYWIETGEYLLEALRGPTLR